MNGDERPEHTETEPDPAEVWRIIWGWITDPKHSNAIIALATLFILLANICYTVYSHLQWRTSDKAAEATRSAANTAATQLELAYRPWVFVKDAKVISPLVFDKSGGHVTFEITVRNAGQSPAVNVFITPRLYMLSGQEESVEPAERLCNAGFYHGDIRGGIMLFPNTDSPPQRIIVGLSGEDIEKAQRRPAFQGKLPIAITPLICVLYRPTFKDVGYSSGIQYDLWPAVWPEKTPTIPVSSLPLHSSGFFGESAH